MSVDFAHRLPLNQIRDGERIDLVADEAERKLTADRLNLRSLDRLEAHATLERKGEIVRARGRLKASLCQSCVVTDEPVEAAQVKSVGGELPLGFVGDKIDPFAVANLVEW
jgi:hypothetical protein